MKVCKKCGLEQDLGSFHKKKDTKDGLALICKGCWKLYYKAHKEEIKATKKVYYEANKEYYAAKNKAYRASHKEEIAANREVTREEQAAYSKAWYKENKESHAAKGKAWRQANPEQTSAQSRKDCRKRRAMRELVNENYKAEDESYTMDLFQHKCYNCYTMDNLEIDHHMPLNKGYALTRDNAVVLCKSCNCSKGTKLPEDFYSVGDLNLLEAILR